MYFSIIKNFERKILMNCTQFIKFVKVLADTLMVATLIDTELIVPALLFMGKMFKNFGTFVKIRS